MEVKRAIPKSVTPDVRYTYTGLLAHVYNSCDYDLMYQFLHTYYRQDFILQQELTGNIFTCNVVRNVRIDAVVVDRKFS
jgi:hypothetical protein